VPPWLTGGASDGREPHSRAAPQAKWSLRIQAEPSYLRRLCRTAPSTSPGGVGACSCRHRGEEESAHTETTDIERYVVSFSFTAPHYTTRPDLGCSGKDLSLHAIHATTSPIRFIQGSARGTFHQGTIKTRAVAARDTTIARSGEIRIGPIRRSRSVPRTSGAEAPHVDLISWKRRYASLEARLLSAYHSCRSDRTRARRDT
jgi:hypothetical protein